MSVVKYQNGPFQITEKYTSSPSKDLKSGRKN